MCVHDIRVMMNRWYWSVLWFLRWFSLHSPHQGYDSKMILTEHLRSELWFRDDGLLFIESGLWFHRWCYVCTTDHGSDYDMVSFVVITSCYDLWMVLLVNRIITRIIMDDSLGHIPVTLDKYSCFNYVNN